MKFSPPSSLRGLVTLIVLVALLPAFGLLTFSYANKAKTESERTERSALSAAHALLFRQMQLAENTRTLLTALAQTKGVQEQNREESEATFQSILNEADAYSAILLYDESGAVIAAANSSSYPQPSAQHIQRLFSQTPQIDAFSANILPAEKQDGLSYRGCILSTQAADGSPMRLLILMPVMLREKDLAELHERGIDSAQIADADGRVLFRAFKNVPVHNIIEATLWKQIRSFDGESGRSPQPDGDILFHKSPMGPDRLPGLALLLKRSTDPATLANSHAIPRVALLVGILLVSVGLIVWLCHKAIISPMQTVIRAAKRIKDGDLNTRIGAAEMPQEIRQMADSLDSMAKAICNRDKDLISARDAAEVAARTKTDFLANMSHELRTPMNAILGMSYLTTQEPLTDHQRNYIDTIRKEADRLLVIINDILDFSKIEAGRLHVEEFTFPLTPLFKEIMQSATAEATTKKLQFTPQIPVALPEYLRGDPHYLRQLIGNLCSASIKISASGEVLLRCAADYSSADKILLEFYLKNPQAGWDYATLSKLFFELTQEEKEQILTESGEDSLRLNLALSQNMALLLGGYLTLEPAPDSNPQSGAAIVLQLPFTLIPTEELAAIKAAEENAADGLASVGKISAPISTTEALGSQNSLRPAVGTPLKGTKILLAEDNLVNQQIAEEILADFGAEVHIAGDGVQALSMLASATSPSGPLPYQVVLMDLQMPNLDGLATTRRIRLNKRYDTLPVIAMTAHTHAEEWDECHKAGMDGFIAKPFDVPELLRVLQHWITPGIRFQQ